MVAGPSRFELPASGGAPGASVEVDLLPCGWSLAPPGWFYRAEAEHSQRRALGLGVPKSDWIRSPIGAFLVRHPRAGPFLVDTGLHPRAAQSIANDFGRLNALAFRTLEMDPAQAVSAQLSRRAIAPGEIDLVIMTHLHVDHTSAMRQFPGAIFVCADLEWQAATARLGVLNGYVRGHLPEPARVRTVDFSAEGAAHGPFRRTVDLFGDGSVRLVFTPGHTRGHLSLLVRLSGGQALLAGDAIYTLRSLHDSLLPWKTADDDLYLDSLEQLRAFEAQRPAPRLIPTHDAQVWNELRELR